MKQATFIARRLAALGLAIAALGSAAPAQAQTATFDEVLAAALVSHPLMLGRRAAREGALADREAAEWARYPTPSVEATSRNVNGSRGVARLEQPLYAGGRIDAGIAAAGHRLEGAGAAVDETGMELRLRVIAACVEVLRHKARLKHAGAAVAEHERLLEMIKRRVQQEVSSQIDQRLAESRLAQAVNDRSAIEQSLRNALAQLSQLAGKPVTDLGAAGLSDEHAPPSQDMALQQALDHSPVMKRLAAEEAAAGADIDVRRAAMLPQLALRLEQTSAPLSERRAMLVLQAQPGAGLAARSAVQSAISRRDAIRMQREAAQRDIAERISIDWSELLAARERSSTAEQARLASTDVFESYTRQYVIGRKSWLDVLNAVREAVQAELALEDARAQAVSASLRLRAQTGTLNRQ
ncbi:outer membrane protein, adhesin transport system [Noviherbaspirillum humi]|uniref:Outer membrane protein, adhesin transport system n=1 Tax=Noviherbaspirillum humi TaxID=1688639 RepID=A0A239HS02_9BURK|nr:TolC family protein [Noviherbaspirillum humi]SNS84011.1 outer membrane protein, adhesin transport system [Noviherbaspirillum humi]